MSVNRIKKVLKLFKGNLIAQILNVSVFFGAAYILPIESIGTYFIFIALTEIIGSFSTFQSHLTIALSRGFKIRMENWRHGTYITLASNFILLFGIIIFYIIYISADLGQTEFSRLYIILPFSSLTYGLNLIGEHFYIANQKYSFISRIKILKVITFSFVAFLTMYIIGGNYALIIAYVAGQVVVFGSYYISSYRKIFERSIFKELKLDLLCYFKKYKNILVFNTIVSPINIISNQLPFIFLPLLYDKGITANYGMVFKTLLFPIMLFSQVYGQDFYINASNIYRKKGSLLNLFIEELKKLFSFAVLPFVIVFFISPWFFRNIMGQEWFFAGQFTRLILIWILVNFVKTPLASLISILQIQKKWLIFEIIQLIVRIGVFGLAFLLVMKVNEAIFFYAIISAIAGVILIIILYGSIIQYERQRL